jgi:transcriptional regulator with XRE-family HTH domain
MPVLNHHKLLEWRRASGLRPEEVCARAGISYYYLRAIESGQRVNPRALVLVQLAAVYDHTIGELFDTEDAA